MVFVAFRSIAVCGSVAGYRGDGSWGGRLPLARELNECMKKPEADGTSVSGNRASHSRAIRPRAVFELSALSSSDFDDVPHQVIEFLATFQLLHKIRRHE